MCLDVLKCNWEEWNRRLNLVVDQRNFSYYLDGTFPCPDAILKLRHARNWKSNDRALRAFILEHLSESDYASVHTHATSHAVYDTLRADHQFQGLHAQVHVIKEALDTRFNPAVVSLTHTYNIIEKLHERFITMGQMDNDKLKIILIINALGDHCERLQIAVNEILQNPAITSADIKARIVREEQLIVRRGTPVLSETTALTAAPTRNGRPICANCKRPSHCTEFCITPGGAMAGKTIEEARAAQDAARNSQWGTSTSRPCGARNNATPAASQANTADATPATTSGNPSTVTVNGQCYVLAPNTNPPPQIATPTALSAVSMADYDQEEYIAVIATMDKPRVSVDWNSHTRTVDSAALAKPDDRTNTRSSLTRPEMPFIFDTGASCHISPEASDFKVLKAIPRHPVKGLCGSAIHAVGVGDIDLRIAGGHVLRLTDVLYIPESSVRLISIHSLNKTGNYSTLFDVDECWVMNRSNTTIARGFLSNSKRLYILSTKQPLIQHQKKTSPPVKAVSALHARVPDIETWHR